MSLIVFLLIGSWSTAVGYTYLRCSNHKISTPDGGKLKSTCTNDGHYHSVVRLPDDLDSKIQDLLIAVYSYGSFEIDSHETFQKFTQLESLAISAKIWLFTPRTVKAWNILRDELFGSLWRLERLYLQEAGFNSQQHSWRFPRNLKTLILSQNNYTELDLSYCPSLVYVDLNDNSLLKFPVFPECLPSLASLNLKNNPLLEFSVNDIARFCRIKSMFLEYQSMGSYHRRCECRRLHNWTAITNLTFDLKCILNDTSPKNCIEYNLDEALKIRNFCFHGWKAIPTCNCSTNCTPCPVQKNNSNICHNESKNDNSYLILIALLLFLAVLISITCCIFFQ